MSQSMHLESIMQDNNFAALHCVDADDTLATEHDNHLITTSCHTSTAEGY